MKLLEDILIIDFSQFLSGPSAALRLADMGAEVIKIEVEDAHTYVVERAISHNKIKSISESAQ